jgi:Flp pilus assembly protein TadG
MKLGQFLARLRRSESGASAVEFALAAPIAMTLMTGVLQVGVAMQSYNALRGMVGDLARQTVVQYSIGVKLTDQQIETDARARGISSPYLLKNANLDIDVNSADDSGIDDVKQIDIRVDYEVQSIVPGLASATFPMTLEKSIFVIDAD